MSKAIKAARIASKAIAKAVSDTIHTAEKAIEDIQELFAETQSALRLEGNVASRWARVNEAVARLYVSKDAFENAKAHFMLHGIAPALYTSEEIALWQGKVGNTWDVPKANSTRYKEAKAAGKAEVSQWDKARETVRNMEMTLDTRFGRIRKAAFPEPKAEGEDKGKGSEDKGSEDKGAKNTLQTKMVKIITSAINKGEKAEGANFNLTLTMQYLRAALEAASKTV